MNLTDFLALYAAVLSTIVSAWTIYSTRSRIRVKLIHALNTVDNAYASGVSISIQNPSPHNVRVTGVSLVYPYRHVSILDAIRNAVRFRTFPRRTEWCHTSLRNHEVRDECPVVIKPGESHNIFISDAIIQKVLNEALTNTLRAVAQDALWRDTYSNDFEY